jgi:hypothetical protein
VCRELKGQPPCALSSDTSTLERINRDKPHETKLTLKAQVGKTLSAKILSNYWPTKEPCFVHVSNKLALKIPAFFQQGARFSYGSQKSYRIFP